MSLNTGLQGIQTQQPSLAPIQNLVGTSFNYNQYISESFSGVTQIAGYTFNRSNAGTAMTDSLQNPVANTGLQPKLPNGWNITVNNIDAIAAITLTPTVPATINGATSLTINAGNKAAIITDGTNFFAFVDTNGTSGTLRPTVTSNAAAVALDSLASGTIINRNHASAMSDTLVVATSLPNGWYITVNNLEGIVADTITPTTSTINGAATLVVGAGQSATIYSTGANYFATIAPSAIPSLQPMTVSTGSPIALSSFASGSIIKRSNATTAMSDTLAHATALPNGWWIEVFNIDASATDTITPTTSTINGTTDIAVTAGQSTIIRTDGANYFATTPA